MTAPTPADFVGTHTPLSDTAMQAAATALKCDVGAVRAVNIVEAPNGGFLPTGQPELLFESHCFHSLTRGKYDRTHPGISTPTWVHNYGAGGLHQYQRLCEAAALDRDAALQSASLGRFQTLGENYAECGYANVEDLVKDMMTGEDAHLNAFVKFCLHENIARYLAAKNWTAFARAYNGPGQVAAYANDLAQAYAHAHLHASTTSVSGLARLPGRAIDHFLSGTTGPNP